MIKKTTQTNNPKLIIFDLDGTLIHFPFHYFFEETHRIFKKNNWVETEQHILEDCFSDFDYFRFLQNDPNHDDMIKKFWLNFDWNNYPASQLIDHETHVLNEIHNNYLTAIATARYGHVGNLPKDLHELGFFLQFSKIHLRESEALDWQDKVPQISRILSEMNVLPENAILVGDTPSDVISAKNASLFGSIAVLSGGIKEHILKDSNPLLIIDSILSLPEALKQIKF